MKVNCPTCSSEVEWSKEAKFRPFCSKRCQMIDLGDWTEEQHKIAGQPALDPSEMTDEQLHDFIQSLNESSHPE